LFTVFLTAPIFILEWPVSTPLRIVLYASIKTMWLYCIKCITFLKISNLTEMGKFKLFLSYSFSWTILLSLHPGAAIFIESALKRRHWLANLITHYRRLYTIILLLTLITNIKSIDLQSINKWKIVYLFFISFINKA
jgi:hypothetical protein